MEKVDAIKVDALLYKKEPSIIEDASGSLLRGGALGRDESGTRLGLGLSSLARHPYLSIHE